MDRRYKTKAIVGATVWAVAVPIFVGSLLLVDKFISRQASDNHDFWGILFLSFFAVQYLTFFWGGSNLAKAKGYSNAIVIAGVFWPAQWVIIPLLLFALPDRCAHSTSQRRRKKRDHHESAVDRVVRYRRNAFLGNLFGIMGVVVAVNLWFLPQGLFSTRDNAGVATVFAFVPSYAAIVTGCWWWAKAKHWNEAVVLIGLAPVIILMIPYVRLIYLAAPLLLPVSMVLMPVLLIGIVAVLPDKSGVPKRKRWDRG